MRLINGLETTTSGTLTVDGFEISGKRDLELQKVRTNIGMIFQQFNLMNSRTVAKNIEFPRQGCRGGIKPLGKNVSRRCWNLWGLTERG